MVTAAPGGSSCAACPGCGQARTWPTGMGCSVCRVRCPRCTGAHLEDACAHTLPFDSWAQDAVRALWTSCRFRKGSAVRKTLRHLHGVLVHGEYLWMTPHEAETLWQAVLGHAHEHRRQGLLHVARCRLALGREA